MLYEKLLEYSKERFDSFFENVTLYENQFQWNEFNTRCFEYMYRLNSYSEFSTVKQLKEEIPELKDTCKKCGNFFMPQRNKSIPKYDVILGMQHEEVLMGFLQKELGTRVERGDLQNRSYPDCVIYNSKGDKVAYFEVKFHGAPFVSALQCTGRYCYEGSATLDYKKIEKQLDLINNEIDVPVYYVHWIEYPCLKGVFYETASQVQDYIEKQHVEFERKKREGDDQKSRVSRYYTKMYFPLLEMKSFDDFVREIKNLMKEG